MTGPATTLAIHGGAGTLNPASITPAEKQALRNGLTKALVAGHRVLAAGGPALDAVAAAVMALEDDEQFNAGRGAVFTSAGLQEMDAAIMDGATSRAGAVAGIAGPRNTVQAARAVMERSPHVLLAGEGALAFLRAQGVPFEDDAYFRTEKRWATLQSVLASREQGREIDDFDRHGTVGAVARDHAGNLAAATSTGGMTGKLPGRIGDTSIPGAGTWADRTCAFSATGHGESFIRIAAGHELSARLRLAGETLPGAASAVMATLASIGGTGGFVAIDHSGQVAMPFNTRGMYRGVVTQDTPPRTAIYKEELQP